VARAEYVAVEIAKNAVVTVTVWAMTMVIFAMLQDSAAAKMRVTVRLNFVMLVY